MSLSRRSLFVTSLALVATPSIVRASSLMPMRIGADISETWGYSIEFDANFVQYRRTRGSAILVIERMFPIGDSLVPLPHVNPHRMADIRRLAAAA